MDEFMAALQKAILEVQDAPDVADGIQKAEALSKALSAAVMDVAKHRRAWFRQAEASGWTLDDIAQLIDRTRSRVEQIINAP